MNELALANRRRSGTPQAFGPGYVSSPLTQRVTNLGWDEFPSPGTARGAATGFTEATVSAWRVTLAPRSRIGLHQVRITAVRKTASKRPHGLAGAGTGRRIGG